MKTRGVFPLTVSTNIFDEGPKETEREREREREKEKEKGVGWEKERRA